jgi:hypothetical protein
MQPLLSAQVVPFGKDGWAIPVLPKASELLSQVQRHQLPMVMTPSRFSPTFATVFPPATFASASGAELLELMCRSAASVKLHVFHLCKCLTLLPARDY